MTIPELTETTAITFEGLMDFNGTWESDLFTPLIEYRMQGAFDNVKWIRTGLTPKMALATKSLREGELQLLMLNGHGNARSVHFGDSPIYGAITTENVSQFQNLFEKVDPKKGLIAINACCKDGVNLLAKKIHELTGRRVCAVENAFSYSSRRFLIRNERTGLFEMHFFDLKGTDTTVLWENGEKKTFKERSNEVSEWIENQGYDLDSLSEQRLQLFAKNTDRAIVPYKLASLYQNKGEIETAQRYYKMAVERARQGSSVPEIIALIELFELHLSKYFECFEDCSTEWDDFIIEQIKTLYAALEEIPSLQGSKYLIKGYEEGKKVIGKDPDKAQQIREKYNQLKPHLDKDLFLGQLDQLQQKIHSVSTKEIFSAFQECVIQYAQLVSLRPQIGEIIELRELLDEHRENLQSVLIERKQESLKLVEDLFYSLNHHGLQFANTFSFSKRVPYIEGIAAADALREALRKLKSLLG